MRRMRHIKAREIQGCDIAYDFSMPSSLYDATTGGSLVAADGAIARCEDLSGNGNHMTQGTGSAQPLRKVAYHNGVDVALFDGSDYLSAGDVADMRDKPVEFFVAGRRTGGSDQYSGFFGKSLAGSAGGRWAVLRELGVDNLIIQKIASSTGATISLGATSTAFRVIYGHADRITASQSTARVNGAQVGSNAVTDAGTDWDTATHVYIGTYQNSAGTAPLGTGVGYLTGYIGEAAKWQREFTPAMRRRFEHSRMRKWRVTG